MKCLHFFMPSGSDEVGVLRPESVGVLRGPWGELEVRLAHGAVYAPEFLAVDGGAVLVVPNSADSEKLLAYLRNLE